MDISEIVNRINENSRLLSAGSISEIDRDVLLDDLRALYLLAKGKNAELQAPEHPKSTAPESQPVTQTKVEIPAPVIEHQHQETKVPEQEPKFISLHLDEEPLTLTETSREEVRVRPASLNEIFAGEEKSLNQKLSGDKRTALNDQAGSKDLKGMIDFNKQYILTNELFKGDSQAFQAAVTRINEAPTVEAAFQYIKTDLMPKYQWNGEMQSARLFDKLVRQKFGL